MGQLSMVRFIIATTLVVAMVFGGNSTIDGNEEDDTHEALLGTDEGGIGTPHNPDAYFGFLDGGDMFETQPKLTLQDLQDYSTINSAEFKKNCIYWTKEPENACEFNKWYSTDGITFTTEEHSKYVTCVCNLFLCVFAEVVCVLFQIANYQQKSFFFLQVLITPDHINLHLLTKKKHQKT